MALGLYPSMAARSCMFFAACNFLSVVNLPPKNKAYEHSYAPTWAAHHISIPGSKAAQGATLPDIESYIANRDNKAARKHLFSSMIFCTYKLDFIT